MKFWMIVNIAERTDADYFALNEAIPKANAPTYMHSIREDAERELLRLAARFPKGEFVLLESVANTGRSNNYGCAVYRIEELKTVRRSGLLKR